MACSCVHQLSGALRSGSDSRRDLRFTETGSERGEVGGEGDRQLPVGVGRGHLAEVDDGDVRRGLIDLAEADVPAGAAAGQDDYGALVDAVGRGLEAEGG